MSSGFSLARRLRAGETVYCGWNSLAAPILAEMMARDGFAAVAIDHQHGLFEIATTIQGIAAVRLGGAAPVVRVAVGDNASVSRVLDLGAEAVIAPMINTSAEARAFAAAAKYPPVGERSWGPARALVLSGMEPAAYLEQGNDLTLAFAMIETQTALDNLAAILATPGIDGVFVGPSDLAIALSGGKSAELTPEVERTIERIGQATIKAGRIAGAYCPSAARARALAAQGYRFMAVGSDIVFMRAGIAETMKGLKS